MSAMIEVSGLTKKFGHVQALDGLDLHVEKGQVHGFLGPNGAGKSTTIRILLGLSAYDSGTVRVFGKDPWHHAVQTNANIAYVPADVALWASLSGGEIIDFVTRLRGGRNDEQVYRQRRERLIELFQLDPSRKARTYSTGNRQKVALICAFATPADVYIFDEPTSGLDPLMDALFHAEIERVVNEEGATVLLSSHILSEVEQLCDYVTIIRAGQTIETGTLAQLQQMTRTTVSLLYREDLYTNIQTFSGAQNLQVEHGKIRFSVDNHSLSALLAHLSQINVEGLVIAPPSLEELFMRHYDTSENRKER